MAPNRAPLTSFLEDPEVLRLMIYMDGKDLAAVCTVESLSVHCNEAVTYQSGCTGCEAPREVQAQDSVLYQEPEGITQCGEYQEECKWSLYTALRSGFAVSVGTKRAFHAGDLRRLC